jgi:ABC-2 type transport system ATP-binding protein
MYLILAAQLKCKSVSKWYVNYKALNNVSLQVPKGSIFGLLGPNGAGKTTLIRIINQITAPDEGEILFNGEALKQKHIAQIGYLPEERGLYSKMKVGEQALYLAQLKGMPKAEAMEKLKKWFIKFGIEEWWNKKIEELSKGMAQKIQFVVTVVHEPELLILDEPFSGFDPINTNLIKDEIMKLRDNGTTVIFSTHNMGSVEEICDRIALINKSEKILEGPVADIKEEHKPHIFKLTFKGNMIKFTNALWTGFELVDHKEIGENTFEAKVKIKENSTPNDLLGALIPNVEILSMNEIMPTMNEIFIQQVTEKNKDVELENEEA